MADPTYDLIATTTLSSDTSSVTISSIPNTYRDIIISFQGEAAQYDSWLGLRMNGDSNSNYDTLSVGNGTSVYTSYTQTEIRSYSHLTTNPGIYQWQVAEYARTDKNKSLFYVGGTTNGSYKTGFGGGIWKSNSAINSITVFGGGGLQMTAGSTIDIWGVLG